MRIRPDSWLLFLVACALSLSGCGDAAAPAHTQAEVAAPASAAPASAAPASSNAPAPSAAAAPAVKPTAADKLLITVSAVGDCTLGTDYRFIGAPGTFHLAMDELNNDFAVPFSHVVAVLGKDDLTIANLEGPLSRARPAVKRPFVFNGKPEYAEILAKGSVELVSVANNHSDDYGANGIEQTLEALDRVGVHAFGNGTIDIRRIKGVDVVNIGYVGGLRGTRAAAVKDVEQHKRKGNLVIVSFHWGVEGLNEPIDDQKRTARAVIDAGADLVLGHHPHVLQGIETYKGRHIVYSLGNFVFGGHSNPADKDSIIYQEVFAREGGVVVSKENRILPVRISSVVTHNDFQPVLLEGADKERVLARVKEYSERLLPRKDRPARAVKRN
jgi:poly-gamma-glutamate capsule biosynthesis protein CapA/YwtB (metallophosphatase superfamily)